MSLSVYDVLVPTMLHGLTVMDDLLDQARTLEQTQDMAPEAMLMTRLAADMLTFGEQISVNCNKVEAHLTKLLGSLPGSPRDGHPATYPGLRRRLLETRQFLEKISPDNLAGAQSRTYELSPPIIRGWFSGDDYIRHLVLPDFFFHITVAHAILRHHGAPIGKRNYLGNLSLESGGYT